MRFAPFLHVVGTLFSSTASEPQKLELPFDSTAERDAKCSPAGLPTTTTIMVQNIPQSFPPRMVCMRMYLSEWHGHHRRAHEQRLILSFNAPRFERPYTPDSVCSSSASDNGYEYPLRAESMGYDEEPLWDNHTVTETLPDFYPVDAHSGWPNSISSALPHDEAINTGGITHETSRYFFAGGLQESFSTSDRAASATWYENTTAYGVAQRNPAFDVDRVPEETYFKVEWHGSTASFVRSRVRREKTTKDKKEKKRRERIIHLETLSYVWEPPTKKGRTGGKMKSGNMFSLTRRMQKVALNN
ncbi:hypothetical protein M422DRAFT_55146 [Sphaerobolus stellatus SS14]|uniref:Uncharacterized protein n=1 Tax=Sphaerobolus stellatus (strain SS14) TaxID=990650 RepID=A0A0C9TDC5_SPHS4|nr:hypothetical protein M422DRAFT_55146 [Sphaerobolus stellatus SS14]